MNLARRIVLVPIGLMLAIPVGMMFLLVGGMIDASSRHLIGNLTLSGLLALAGEIGQSGSLEALGVFLLGLMLIASILLVAPLLLVALIGEVLGRRGLGWYALGTGAMTAIIPWIVRGGPLSGGAAAAAERASLGELRMTLLLFLTGIVSGFVYWVVSGRTAGVAEPETEFPLPHPPR